MAGTEGPFNDNFSRNVYQNTFYFRGTIDDYVETLKRQAIELYEKMVGSCAKKSSGGTELSKMINAFVHPPGVAEIEDFAKNPDCFEDIRQLCSIMIHYRLAEEFFQTTPEFRNTFESGQHMFQAVLWMKLLSRLESSDNKPRQPYKTPKFKYDGSDFPRLNTATSVTTSQKSRERVLRSSSSTAASESEPEERREGVFVSQSSTGASESGPVESREEVLPPSIAMQKGQENMKRFFPKFKPVFEPRWMFHKQGRTPGNTPKWTTFQVAHMVLKANGYSEDFHPFTLLIDDQEKFRSIVKIELNTPTISQDFHALTLLIDDQETFQRIVENGIYTKEENKISLQEVSEMQGRSAGVFRA